jgi:hypothetical protein
MMKYIALLLLTCGACALQAQSYTVSDGALGSYPVLSGATDLALADDDLSAPISPSGFSFFYFGAYYTSFQVGTNGYLVLGGNGSTTATSPDHGAAPGLAIAPCWVNLQYPFGGASYIRWRMVQGVLQVEWNNMAQGGGPVGSMPPPSADVVVLLDTQTGVIEFDYGFPGASNIGVTSTLPNTAAISSASGAGQEVIPAYIAGKINIDGSIASWPQYRYVRFTPALPPTNSSPQVSVSIGGVPVSSGATVNVAFEQSLASLNIQINVTDSENDSVTLVGTVGNLSGEGILDAEFSSPSAGTPYTLTPAAGSFNRALATLAVTLVASDGISSTSQFSFSFQVGVPAGTGLSGGGGGGGAGCSGAGRARLPIGLLTLLAFAACCSAFGSRRLRKTGTGTVLESDQRAFRSETVG